MLFGKFGAMGEKHGTMVEGMLCALI